MKRLRHIFLIILVIVVQMFLVLLFTAKPVNLAKIPYRRAERAAALEVLANNPSPENKAAFQEELHLAGRYSDRQQFTKAGLVFAALLSVEVIVIYFGRHHNYKYKAVAP